MKKLVSDLEVSNSLYKLEIERLYRDLKDKKDEIDGLFNRLKEFNNS